MLALAAITAHLYAAIPMVVFPVSQLLEEGLLGERNDTWYFVLRSVLIRSVLLCFSVLVAVLLPFFGDIVALLGASSISATVLIFPVLIYSQLFRGTVPLFQNFVHGVILAIGMVLTVTGTYASAAAIAAKCDSYHLLIPL